MTVLGLISMLPAPVNFHTRGLSTASEPQGSELS